MKLLRLPPRLAARDEFGSRQGKQVAQLGGVQEPRRLEVQFPTASQVADSQLPNRISSGVRLNRAVLQQDRQSSAAAVRRQHGFEHGQRRSRFVAQPRDRTAARVQMLAAPRGVRQGIELAIVLPNAMTQARYD